MVALFHHLANNVHQLIVERHCHLASLSCVHGKNRFLRSTTSDVDVIILSTFLLLTWSSLRFADAQRCNIDGLCYTDQILRGICWQTKTVSNLAWGLIGNGFLTRNFQRVAQVLAHT